MRLKNTATNSAGFTIEGTDAAHRTFIGTMNDNHLGIFSQSGIGWFFSMNVNDGNTGIGLANPTAKLDVSNSMRLRSGSPKLGSVLISADANGNAEWQQPWGFDAMGSFPSANEVLINTWSKIRFGYLSVTLNEGNSYDLNNGWFTAPVNGIYDLHLHVTFNDDYGHDKTYIRIIQQRNGVNTELLRYDLNQVHLNSLDPNTNGLYKLVKYPNLNYTTGGIVLNAADKIWAEVYAADRIIYRPTGSSITETWLDANDCKMTGSLVVKL
jgi:hypothetical protein